MQKQEWTDMGQILDLHVATKFSVWICFFLSLFLLLETSGNPKALGEAQKKTLFVFFFW